MFFVYTETFLFQKNVILFSGKFFFFQSTSTNTSFQFQIWEAIWYGCITLFGVIGNVIVVVVMLASKKIKRTSTFNILVFSLAVADLLASITSFPIYFLGTNVFHHPTGNLGNWMCKLIIGSLITFWMMDASTYLLVYIAFERHRVVLYPLLLLTNSVKNTLLKVALIFFAAFLVHFLPRVFGMVYKSSESSYGNFCDYSFTNTMTITVDLVIFVMDTLIPFALMVICFWRISSSVKKANSFFKGSQFAVHQHKSKHNLILDRQTKTIKTMRIVVFAFIFCILPNRLLFFLSLFVKSLGKNSVVYQVFVLLRFSNSLVNPAVYSLYSREFRRHFRSVFIKKRIKKLL